MKLTRGADYGARGMIRLAQDAPDRVMLVSDIAAREGLPESYLAGSLSAAATVSDEQELKRILAEAAMLGVDLLTPEGPES